jgi:hypothetical protein
MSPWVAAVELIVDGTVSKKEAEVPKGGEISNPHPPCRKPARQTRGYAQPVIIPKYTLTNNIPQLVRVSVVADGQCLLAAFLGASIS